uniref:Polyamine modulated factor 1 n=1 Tax=Ictidomys tridecemlineatus TaxID=43179 RepID=A0A287DE43_ICTTR
HHPASRSREPAQLGTGVGTSVIWFRSRTLPHIVPPSLSPTWPFRRPSGIPEKDLCSTMAPYFLQQRDTLRCHVQKQEAKNRELADAILAGRKQLEELQLQVQARQQAWQALHGEQRELVAVLREPE